MIPSAWRVLISGWRAAVTSYWSRLDAMRTMLVEAANCPEAGGRPRNCLGPAPAAAMHTRPPVRHTLRQIQAFAAGLAVLTPKKRKEVR